MKDRVNTLSNKATLFIIISSSVFCFLAYKLLFEPSYTAFRVDNPNTSQEFVLTRSYFSFGNPVSIEVLVEGHLDAKAVLVIQKENTIFERGSQNFFISTIRLRKGVLLIKCRFDFYEGRKVKIVYRPFQVKEGRVRIKARIL